MSLSRIHDSEAWYRRKWSLSNEWCSVQELWHIHGRSQGMSSLKKKTKSSWQTFYQNPTDLLMSCDFFPLSRPLVMILTTMTTTGTELNIPTYSFSFFLKHKMDYCYINDLPCIFMFTDLFMGDCHTRG
jgi:hypothetical protein